jgi:hypothetical protein
MRQTRCLEARSVGYAIDLALGPPAHDEPDRIDVRDGKAPDQDHQGPGSRAAGLAVAFKLIESAQDRWRAVNAPHLVALVRAGAVFVNGELVERPGEDARLRPPEVHRRPSMTPGLRGRLHDQRHEATMLEDPCGRCSRS